MAPPDKPFPVSELEQRIQSHTVNWRQKSRKLPKDFNLKDCELFELVQYSCTTQAQQQENVLKNPRGTTRMECFPFVRLFRRCMNGEKMFHVETTAWEGQHAWQSEKKANEDGIINTANKNAFAEYGNYFRSKK